MGTNSLAGHTFPIGTEFECDCTSTTKCEEKIEEVLFIKLVVFETSPYYFYVLSRDICRTRMVSKS